MTRLERERLYWRAEKKWGTTLQLIMAMEEMAELTQVISKVLLGKEEQQALAEEIADVEIMVEQLKLITANSERVAIIKLNKLERLEERLTNK